MRVTHAEEKGTKGQTTDIHIVFVGTGVIYHPSRHV